MAFWSISSGKNIIAARNKNGIAFLISWLFAFVLWLLTSLNAERVMEIEIRFAFDNVPHQVRLKEPLPTLKVNVAGEGLELFRFLRRSKHEVVKVDYDAIRDGRWTPKRSEISKALGLNEKVRLNAFVPDFVSIDSKRLYFKKLPIVVNNQITYSEGFDSISPALLSKDSVILYANQPIPSHFKHILTEELKLYKVNKPFSKTLKLKLPKLQEAKLSFNQIDYRLEVDKIISNEIEISIDKIGFPSNVILIPSTIKVRYLVAARDFQDVQITDFKASVNWSAADNQSFLIPELRVLNSLVLDTEIFPKTIDYLQP